MRKIHTFTMTMGTKDVSSGESRKLATKFSEMNVVDPEHVVLALMRLRDFLVKGKYNMSR